MMETRPSESYDANTRPTTMSKRRSKFEISLAILDTIPRGNDKPTRIMSSTNISWLVLQRSLLTLESNGLISKDNHENRSIYSVTEKGYSVLKGYRTVKESFDS